MARIVKDWTKYIVPRSNKNTYYNNMYGDIELNPTTDYVYSMSTNDMRKRSPRSLRRSPTDFAIMNNAGYPYTYKTWSGKNTGRYWLRTPSNCNGNLGIDYDGFTKMISSPGSTIYGLSPSFSIKLPEGISIDSIKKHFGEIKRRRLPYNNTCYTLEIGEYPKTNVSGRLAGDLEYMYNGGNLRGDGLVGGDELKCTGRLYTTNGHRDGRGGFQIKENPEFEYKGQRYVRTTVWTSYDKLKYEDGSDVPKNGRVEWVKVEPITVNIVNYENIILGTADTLDLDCEEIILGGIPFFQEDINERRDNTVLWQNSIHRAFLNSALSSEMDGSDEHRTFKQWDFRQGGFLQQAFNMTRDPIREYVIPVTEEKICDNAFDGCVGIEKFIIPPHVIYIGSNAFKGCINSQIVFRSPNSNLGISNYAFEGTKFKYIYVKKDGEDLILSSYKDASLNDEYICSNNPFYSEVEKIDNFLNHNFRKNFAQLQLWKNEGKIKFIPPDYTLKIFPSSEMKKYFVNNNNQRWSSLVKTLGFDTLKGIEKNNSLTDLMKIYYAIGGFSENQGESENAYEYLLKCYTKAGDAQPTPKSLGEEVHYRFSKIKIKGPYNPTFAQFFMKYYYDNPRFMFFAIYSRDDNLMEGMDYLCMAHNAFDRIMKCYPNKVVNGNEKRALLTPRFVAKHSAIVEYDDIDAGNELLAETVGMYGYDEDQFQQIQNVYNRAKAEKDKHILEADSPSDLNGITFRILDKDDPLGFVIGDITNCCQHIDGEAEKCVIDGYLNPNAGFLVFEYGPMDENQRLADNARILAQAYVWYDPETKTVCYDNIEIPTKVLDELKRGDKHGEIISSKRLMDAVVESADAIMLAMNRKGIRVDRVTTGQGHNDLRMELEKKFGSPEYNPIAKHRSYRGYSDAEYAQYLIRKYDTTTKFYSNKIRNTAQKIRDDLDELSHTENKNELSR